MSLCLPEICNFNWAFFCATSLNCTQSSFQLRIHYHSLTQSVGACINLSRIRAANLQGWNRFASWSILAACESTFARWPNAYLNLGRFCLPCFFANLCSLIIRLIPLAMHSLSGWSLSWPLCSKTVAIARWNQSLTRVHFANYRVIHTGTSNAYTCLEDYWIWQYTERREREDAPDHCTLLSAYRCWKWLLCIHLSCLL